MTLLSATLLFLAVALQGSAKTVKHTLNIVNKPIAPDGFKRSATYATLDGGAQPNPVIRANKGDDFSITVSDQLTDGSMAKSTSVHWHGLFQHGTTWADGPAGVNQCPIAPGHSFTYNFKAADQTGTFWYHSHYKTQYCDGLRGPLVIYDPNDPYKHLYDYDDENTILTVADWYHMPAQQVIGIAHANSTLINGLGRYPGGPKSELAVVSVQQGKRYRMRLISMACDPHFTFQIDGHDMTIIEVDGISHKPYTVDEIELFAGQRYSFILNANKPIKNYWIRADPNNGAPDWTLNGFEDGRNSAILRYLGAPLAEPSTKQDTSKHPLNEAALVPYDHSPAPGHPKVGGADVNINLNISVDLSIGRFLINGKSFETPDVPVLLQILSGAKAPQDILPNGLLYPLPRGKTIELSMPGGVPGSPHPIHLHGHSFWVVRSAGQHTYNYANPPIRDVVSIGDVGDNVTIRFRTDSPGPWFLHCHIDFHFNAGFAMVFAEDMPDIKSYNPVPQAWKDLCPIYDQLGPGDQ